MQFGGDQYDIAGTLRRTSETIEWTAEWTAEQAAQDTLSQLVRAPLR